MGGMGGMGMCSISLHRHVVRDIEIVFVTSRLCSLHRDRVRYTEIVFVIPGLCWSYLLAGDGESRVHGHCSA